MSFVIVITTDCNDIFLIRAQSLNIIIHSTLNDLVARFMVIKKAYQENIE